MAARVESNPFTHLDPKQLDTALQLLFNLRWGGVVAGDDTVGSSASPHCGPKVQGPQTTARYVFVVITAVMVIGLSLDPPSRLATSGSTLPSWSKTTSWFRSASSFVCSWLRRSETSSEESKSSGPSTTSPATPQTRMVGMLEHGDTRANTSEPNCTLKTQDDHDDDLPKQAVVFVAAREIP